MTITIKTHLNSGIYKSCGGGETRSHYEWTTGPRNLSKAVDQYFDHLRDMERSYGNIGCGSSWVEIDGVRINAFDLQDLREGDDAGKYNPKTRTQKCREFIQYVRSGEYEKYQAAIAAMYD